MPETNNLDNADGETRTRKACATRPSSVRVYQFHHNRVENHSITNYADSNLAYCSYFSQPHRKNSPILQRLASKASLSSTGDGRKTLKYNFLQKVINRVHHPLYSI